MTDPAAPLLARLRACPTDGRPDAELLRAYAAARDGDAFRCLVERHGPMVLGVCRRVLGDAHDAEDAFQAVFLALARHAGSVRRPEALAGWLYRAAGRVARKARAARRKPAAAPAPAPPADPLAALTARELLGALDAELARLPERLQLPLALCYWHGLSRAEAARRLGWTAAALHGRLERGRAALALRLRARGLGPPLVLAPLAAAAVPAGLAARAAELAGSPAGAVPRAVAALARAAAPSAAPAVLAAGAALIALALLVPGSDAQPASPAAADRPPAAPRADVAGDPLPPGAVARLGGDRWRHEGEAQSVAFSADGKTLAVLSTGDNTVSFLETATGKRLDRLAVPRVDWRGGRTIAFSPDGAVFAYQVGGGAVHLFDARTRRPLRVLTPAAEDFEAGIPAPIRFSPDGKLLAASTAGPTITVWDVATGKEVAAVTGHRHANPGIAFSADGKTLATIADGPSVWFCDPRTGKRVGGFDLDPPGAFCLAYSPDGTTLATGYRDRITVWDVATGEELFRLEAKMGGVNGLAFTPDGRSLVSGSGDAKARVWDLAARTERHVLDGRGWIGRSVALSPDGKAVALGAVYNLVRVWDVAGGKELPGQPEGHDAPVHAVAFSPDGTVLVTGGANQQLRMWDAATGRHLRRLPGHSATSLSFSPDGKRLATAWPNDATARVRDVGRGETLFELAHAGAAGVAAVAFTPDGKAVVSAARRPGGENFGRTAVQVWDAAAGKPLRDLTLAGLRPEALALSPDGRWAAVGGAAGNGSDPGPSLRLCDLDRARERRVRHEAMSYVASVAFSPDGRLVAAGNIDRRTRLVEVATGREVMQLAGHERSVAAVAFAPGGRVLATADGGPESRFWDDPGPQTVRFWDVVTGRELARLTGHDSDVTSLAFSPDGKRLVGGLRNGTVLVWEVPADAKPAATAGRKLAAEELAALGADLARDDAGKAYAAVRALVGSPDQAVALLAGTLRPAAKPDARPDAEQVRRWIADLDADTFAAREAAARQLARLGEDAEPELRAVLESGPPLEVRRRVEALLTAALDSPPADRRREVRGVWALELVGTPAARGVLAKLAGGDPAARLTREAKAALDRR